MVNIDTVYQRVLALANKEQRGYVTPLEFNLLANQAQLDIFEQYFYDINQNETLPGNDRQYSDVEHMLNEKISPFEIANVIQSGTALPGDLYLLGQVIVGVGAERYICEEITIKELTILEQSKLARPSIKRPVYTTFSNPNSPVGYGVSVVGPPPGSTFSVSIGYIRVPNNVEWGYNVIAKKALYNASNSTNFELHSSEETKLVIKILELAGIVINKPGLISVASGKEAAKIQQQKA